MACSSSLSDETAMAASAPLERQCETSGAEELARHLFNAAGGVRQFSFVGGSGPGEFKLRLPLLEIANIGVGRLIGLVIFVEQVTRSDVVGVHLDEYRVFALHYRATKHQIG